MSTLRRNPSPTELKRLTAWRISTFWVLLIGYIGYYLCRANLPAAFPLLEKEFGYSNIQLGLIAAYSEVAYAVGKFINGPLADRTSGKTMFLTGMAGAIVFNLVFGLSTSLTAFIFAWCMCRYFLSMGWGGLAKVVGNWYPPEKNGTIMGFISINFQFGGVVGVLLSGALVAAGLSWSELFFYPAGILFLIMIWSYLASKNHPDEIVPNTNFNQSVVGKKQMIDFGHEGIVPTKVILKKLLGMRFFWYLLMYSFIIHMVRSVFMFWTPKYLTDIGMGTSLAIMTSAVFPLLGCLGTIFIGWYSDNYAKNGDRARMMWIMLVALTFCLLLLSYLTTFEVKPFVLILVMLGASGFLLLGPYSMSAGALTLDLVGAQAAGTCTGMLDGIGYIGGAVASWGVGYLSVRLGWSQVYIAIALCAVLSAFAAFLMSKKMSQASS